MDLTASLSIIVFLLVLELVLYVKYRLFRLILVVYLFSLIIGGLALTVGTIPFTPYFQMFFMLFQTIILIYAGIDYNTVKKKQKNRRVYRR